MRNYNRVDKVVEVDSSNKNLSNTEKLKNLVKSKKSANNSFKTDFLTLKIKKTLNH